MNFPPPIERLMRHFRMLPGVGPRTATRFVFALLTKSEDELRAFGHALVDLKESVRTCGQCFNLSLQNPCAICADQKRDHGLLCILARPQDIQSIEETREYRGLYHVLGGTLNPIEGVTPDQLRIKELLNRIDNPSPSPLPAGEGGRRPGEGIKEVILAFNPDLEGEATSLYLSKLLKTRVERVTRLARGLQQGADLEYADEVTLINAIKGRREI
ncbi:MAG: toprim domain-containing protein [bacterium]|nr:toprim domain-containing protein [bacterium]